MGRGLQFVTEKTQPGAVAGVGEGDLTSPGLWSLKYITIWTADLRLSEPAQANLIPSLCIIWRRITKRGNKYFHFSDIISEVLHFFCIERGRKCEEVLD